MARIPTELVRAGDFAGLGSLPPTPHSRAAAHRSRARRHREEFQDVVINYDDGTPAQSMSPPAST